MNDQVLDVAKPFPELLSLMKGLCFDIIAKNPSIRGDAEEYWSYLSKKFLELRNFIENFDGEITKLQFDDLTSSDISWFKCTLRRLIDARSSYIGSSFENVNSRYVELRNLSFEVANNLERISEKLEERFTQIAEKDVSEENSNNKTAVEGKPRC